MVITSEEEKHTNAQQSWKTVCIKDVCESIIDCVNKTAPTVDYQTPYKMIRTNNVRHGRIDLSNVKYVTKEVFEIWTRRMIPKKGDIILTREAPLGEVGMIREDEHIFLGQRLMQYRANPSYLDNRFLLYAFQEHTLQEQIKLLGSGATVEHMRVPDAEKLIFRLPPLPEQQAIANALSDIDALITSLDKLIAKKRAIKRATMQQLLTGKTRLPGFSGEWKVKRLSNVGICLRGVSYNGDHDLSPYDTNNTLRLLRSNNVKNAKIVTSEIQFVNSARVSSQQVLQDKDVLICMANGSKELVGKAGQFRVEDGYRYTFGAFMGCFRINSTFHPTFIFYLFQTNRYRNYINNLLAGSSINNLKPSDIESLEFIFPETDEQTAIATVLSDMDAEIAALEQRRAKSHTLKQGMMQELLTGKTRLL